MGRAARGLARPDAAAAIAARVEALAAGGGRGHGRRGGGVMIFQRFGLCASTSSASAALA